MRITTFLEHLRWGHRKWTVNMQGQIRCYATQVRWGLHGEYNPITAVCRQLKHGDFPINKTRQAAFELGLMSWEADWLAYVFENQIKNDPELRGRILRACRIKERSDV